MTLDDLTNAQFTVLIFLSMGCILLVGVMIRLATEKRQD
jgi:cell division protein FtsX